MQSSSGAARVPVVAIVNTSQEVADLLQVVFQIEGFQAVTAFTLDIKEGRLDFGRFVAEHQPDAVVWDIAIPYEANWAFFEQVSGSQDGQRCPFILTTTNKAALESLVGEVPALELVGKPFDLDEIVNAVRRAIDNHPVQRDRDRDPAAHDSTT